MPKFISCREFLEKKQKQKSIKIVLSEYLIVMIMSTCLSD